VGREKKERHPRSARVRVTGVQKLFDQGLPYCAFSGGERGHSRGGGLNRESRVIRIFLVFGRKIRTFRGRFRSNGLQLPGTGKRRRTESVQYLKGRAAYVLWELLPHGGVIRSAGRVAAKEVW